MNGRAPFLVPRFRIVNPETNPLSLFVAPTNPREIYGEIGGRTAVERERTHNKYT